MALVSAHVALRHTLSIRLLLQLITEIKDSSPCKALTEENVKGGPLVVLPSILFCNAASSHPMKANRSLRGEAEDSHDLSTFFLDLLKASIGFYHVLICGVFGSGTLKSCSSAVLWPCLLTLPALSVLLVFVVKLNCLSLSFGDLGSVSLAVHQRIHSVMRDIFRLFGFPL